MRLFLRLAPEVLPQCSLSARRRVWSPPRRTTTIAACVAALQSRFGINSPVVLKIKGHQLFDDDDPRTCLVQDDVVFVDRGVPKPAARHRSLCSCGETSHRAFSSRQWTLFCLGGEARCIHCVTKSQEQQSRTEIPRKEAAVEATKDAVPTIGDNGDWRCGKCDDEVPEDRYPLYTRITSRGKTKFYCDVCKPPRAHPWEPSIPPSSDTSQCSYDYDSDGKSRCHFCHERCRRKRLTFDKGTVFVRKGWACASCMELSPSQLYSQSAQCMMR